MPVQGGFSSSGYLYSDNGATIQQEAQVESGIPGIVHFGPVGTYYNGWQASTNHIVQGYAEYEKKTVISDTYSQTGDGLKFDGLAIYSDGLSSQNLQTNGTGTFCSFAQLPSEQFMQAEAAGPGRNGHYKNDKMLDGTTYGFSTILADVDDTNSTADASITVKIHSSALSGFYPNSSGEANYRNEITDRVFVPNSNVSFRKEWFGDDFSNPYNLTTNKTALSGG